MEDMVKNVTAEEEATVEEEAVSADHPEVLSMSELEAVDGGKVYEVERNSNMFCPFCMRKHVISVIKGKEKVGRYYHRLYYCYNAREYFIHADNGYFTMEGEWIHV